MKSGAADTGLGIPVDEQPAIFELGDSGVYARNRAAGIGPGLPTILADLQRATAAAAGARVTGQNQPALAAAELGGDELVANVIVGDDHARP